MKVAVILLVVLLTLDLSSSSNITIINGPQDTIVCTNATAECDCGFIGADPNFVIPNWRIIFRSEDNRIISNVTYNGYSIVNEEINGLQWVPDLTSGDNNAPNSKLLVGPVNMTHNQLSCQCIIEIINDTIISSVGTITVVDPLSVTINVDEICTTSITISLNTYSHPICGNVSYDVTVSGNVVYPDNSGGSKYTIDELQSNTQYNIVVISRHNNNFRTFNKSVITLFPKAPNPINVTSIKIAKIDNNDLRITWKMPEIDKCSMSALKCYYVKIISSEGEIVLERNVTETTVVFQYLDYSSSITFIVNITVVDITEQRSNPSVTMKLIEFGIHGNSTESDQNNDSNILVIVIATAVAVIAVIVIIVVSVFVIIFLRRYCHAHKSYDVALNEQTSLKDKNSGYAETQQSFDAISGAAVSGPVPSSHHTVATESNENEGGSVYGLSIHKDYDNENESTSSLNAQELQKI